MPFLPDDNLEYPVLITFPTSAGSGFYFTANNNTYLVTAKHVVVDDSGAPLTSVASLISYKARLTHKMEILADFSILFANGDVKLHPTADVAVIKLGVGAGDPPILHMSNGVVLSPTLSHNAGITCMLYENVDLIGQVGLSNEAFIFGYPISIGGPNQLEPTKPLIRRGAVAGLNTLNDTIIIDAPSYQGNSGGLVIEVEDEGTTRNFRAIGVLVSFVPFVEETQSLHFKTINRNVENSGYSVVEPMDRVFELLSLPLTPSGSP